jgi:hypothetical protein
MNVTFDPWRTSVCPEKLRLVGHIARVNRSGQLTGRAEMSLDFDRILLLRWVRCQLRPDKLRMSGQRGETGPVDNEGTAQGESSQTSRTVMRTGVGAAIGPVP